MSKVLDIKVLTELNKLQKQVFQAYNIKFTQLTIVWYTTQEEPKTIILKHLSFIKKAFFVA